MISVIHVLNKFSVTASARSNILLKPVNKPAIFSGSSNNTQFNQSLKVFNKKVLSHICYPFFSILFFKIKTK